MNAMLQKSLAPSFVCFKPIALRRMSTAFRNNCLTVAGAKKKKAQAPPEPAVLPEQPIEPVEKDFFEGEGWEIFGKIVSFSVPVMLVLGVIVGAFAAGTYNEGATVFLDTPKNQDDTAKFYSVTDDP